MQGLIEGRQVHYVLTGQETAVMPHAKEKHRPATVVQVWDSGVEGDVNHGRCNLLVHVDGFNDLSYKLLKDSGGDQTHPVVPQIWVTSVLFSEEKEPGTWHWIEPA